MNKTMRVLLAAAITLTGLFGFASVASAQPTSDFTQCKNSGSAGTGNESSGEGSGDATQANGDNCNNEGDADGETDQNGSASSGDGVAGQVAGVVSAGDASVDATNRSDDVDVTTGDATGTNLANMDVRSGLGFGQELSTDTSQCLNDGSARTSNEDSGENSGNASQNTGDNCLNDGDADGAIGQTADAASGDGVGGQVIGVVTSAGGSADLVLDNESSDAEVESGEGDFTNDGDSFVDSGIFFDVAP
jgi:hypothetical protein